jgi:hypothetical protein
MRIFERAFAAGGVPVAFSEGFHPHVRMSFGPPLKTGWESLEEYMDVQLDAPMDGLAAAVNAKLPDGLRVTRAVPIADRAPKLAVDIVAVAMEVVLTPDDAIAAGAPASSNGNGAGPDAAAIRSALSNRFLHTPNAENGLLRVLEADVVRNEDALRIRYTSTMDNGRIVTPDEVVSASIGDPASFRVPIKVTRLAQFVTRDGRRLSPIDEGAVQASS